MRVAGRADSPARVRLDESSLNATQRHRGVHNGNDDGALWPAETLQFEEKLVQLRNVIEHQATEDAIKRGAFQRQRFRQIMLHKIDRSSARLGARALQHGL